MGDAKITTDAFYVSVGEKLRLYRKKAGMDQETLSRHLELSRPTIINIEKGRQRLSLEQAWLAAHVLGVPIADLLPPTTAKSVDDWKKKIKESVQIKGKQKKVVLDFISEIRSEK